MSSIGESLTSPNNTFRFRQFLPQYLSCPPDYFLLRLEVSKQSVQPKTYKYWQHANVIVKAKRNRVNARIELRLMCQAGYMQMAVGCQMQIIAQKNTLLHTVAHKRHTDCRLLPTGDIHCIALEEAACCKGADNPSRVQEYQIWIKQILCQDSLHTNGSRTFAPRILTSADIGSSSPPGPSVPPRH